MRQDVANPEYLLYLPIEGVHIRNNSLRILGAIAQIIWINCVRETALEVDAEEAFDNCVHIRHGVE